MPDAVCRLDSGGWPADAEGRTLLALVYITVFVTALAFVLMNIGIKYTTANTSSLILSTEAVFGVAFSMLFYRERPSLQEMIGFAVILAAVLLSELKPGKKTPGR